MIFFHLFYLRELIYNIFPLVLFKRNNIFPLVPFPVGRHHLRIHSLLQSPLRVRLPLTTPPLTMGAWSLLLKIERSRIFLQIHRSLRPHLVATDFLMFFCLLFVNHVNFSMYLNYNYYYYDFVCKWKFYSWREQKLGGMWQSQECNDGCAKTHYSGISNKGHSEYRTPLYKGWIYLSQFLYQYYAFKPLNKGNLSVKDKTPCVLYSEVPLYMACTAKTISKDHQTKVRVKICVVIYDLNVAIMV